MFNKSKKQKNYIQWIRIGGELFCDNDETLELKYFPLNNTPKLFCKQHEELLEDIKAKR